MNADASGGLTVTANAGATVPVLPGSRAACWPAGAGPGGRHAADRDSGPARSATRKLAATPVTGRSDLTTGR